MFSKRIRIRILIKGRFWRGVAFIYIYRDMDMDIDIELDMDIDMDIDMDMDIPGKPVAYNTGLLSMNYV